MHVGELVAKYREKNRYSQRAFAEKCGISNAYISIIEKNMHPSTGKPPVYTIQILRKLAKGMEMNVNDLVNISDNMKIEVNQNVPGELHQFISGSDVLRVNKPRDNMQPSEVRKFLHDLIDELGDDDLYFMQDLSMRIAKK